jgi:hypothetical protein
MDISDDPAVTADGLAIHAVRPKPCTADAMLVALRAVLHPPA